MKKCSWTTKILIAIRVSVVVLIAVAVADYFDVLSLIGIDISKFNADVWTGIIIPMIAALLAALIGGGITMWGVVYTIKAQQKDEEKRRRDEVRPFLYSYPKEYGYQKPIMKTYVLSSRDEPCMHEDMAYFGIIKNTDNGIVILDRVETENNRYYPEADTVVEKNQMFELKVRWVVSGNETLKDVRLFVKDIYGNEYQYPASLSEQKGIFFSLGKCKEM